MTSPASGITAILRRNTFTENLIVARRDDGVRDTDEIDEILSVTIAQINKMSTDVATRRRLATEYTLIADGARDNILAGARHSRATLRRCLETLEPTVCGKRYEKLNALEIVNKVEEDIAKLSRDVDGEMSENVMGLTRLSDGLRRYYAF